MTGEGFGRPVPGGRRAVPEVIARAVKAANAAHSDMVADLVEGALEPEGGAADAS